MKLSHVIKRRTPLTYLLYSGIIGLGIGIDMLTKHLATVFLKPIDSVPLIEGVLHLKYHTNRGAAWGLFVDAPWVFNTISAIAITAMLLYLYLGHCSSRLQGIAIAIIASGGIGNMIERISQGYVVDFIYFKLINFPIFNGADSFVCVGAGLLILSLILEIRAEAAKNKGRSE